MRQFEGYSFTTPITIGDVHNLSKQVTRLPRGSIALLGTDRLGIPLEQLDIELTPRDDYAEGRRNSINEVGFYDATLYCSDIPLVTQPWAIKPYLTSRTAVKDIATMQAINSLQHPRAIRTFEPRGIARLENGEVAVISDFIQGVRSCDSLVDAYRETTLPEEKARLIARTAFSTMHYFHSLPEPYTMNDAQIKNFAFTINTEPWCIDTEKFLLTDKDDPSSIGQFGRDIECCVYSMSGQSNNDGQQMLIPELIIEHFIKPYEEDISNLFSRDTASIIQTSIENLKQDITQGV